MIFVEFATIMLTHMKFKIGTCISTYGTGYVTQFWGRNSKVKVTRSHNVHN